MGLDNGITLITRQKLTEHDIPPYIHIDIDDWEDEHDNRGYHYEICYWRKCWNIRSIVFDINDNAIDNGIFELDMKHVYQLEQKITEYIVDIQKWQDDYEGGRTIWDADDMLPHLAQDVVNLQWLENYMKKHRAIVEFYDSY